jgi:hypothetical protein
MDKSELKRKVKYLTSFGTGRSEVFSELSGQGLKDSQLALVIANCADPALAEAHKLKVRLLMALMLGECAGTVAVFAYTMSELKMGFDARWMQMYGLALVPLLFAWAFRKPFARAYFAYAVFSLTYLINLVGHGFKQSQMGLLYGLPTGLAIPQQLFQQWVPGQTGMYAGLALALAQIGFVWYVGVKLFPDLTLLLWPRKTDGNYVFSS